MLSQHCSFDPVADLLSQADVLAVIPLHTRCEPDKLGTIYSGIPAASTLIENNGELAHDDRSQTIPKEVWRVPKGTKLTRGQSAGCQWSKTDDVMCVAYWLSADECLHIEQSTFSAYINIFSALNQHGFTQPFRMWNYLPDINHGRGDDEVYKRFCTGRLRAFEHLSIPPASFPAASALGHHGHGAVIYALASPLTPIHYNNQRQVNAYEYPRQYGISSPSFARATVWSTKSASHLFISGTASIVGHETLHEGDLIKQLQVTADNIELLLASANADKRKHAGDDFCIKVFKVYVRHLHHVAKTQAWLNEHYPHVLAIITLADICRAQLLVEIEGFCE